MASNSAYKGLTVKIGANTNDAAKALKEIDDKARGVTNDLGKLNKSLKLDPGNVDLLTDKQRLLEKQIQKTKERLEVFQEIQAKGRNQKGMDEETWARVRTEIIDSKIKLEDFQRQAKECKETLKGIGDPFKKLEREAAEAEKAVEKTAEELKVLSNALKVDPKNTELLTRQQEVLGRQIENTTQKLEKYREIEAKGKDHDGMDETKWTQLKANIALAENELEELTEQSKQCDYALRGIGEHDDDFDEIAKEIAEMEDAVEDANADLDKMDDKLDEVAKTSKLDKVGSGFQKVGDTIEDGSRKVAEFGDAYTRTVSTGIVAGAAASVKAAVTIDDAMTSVRKTVEGTEEQYQELKDAAIEFSQTNAVSADQILELDALGAQLGFSLDELKEFGEVASGLDIATDMSAEQAATEMAQFANITKMAHDDISRYASTIVELGNNMATTESKVSAMAQRVAAAGTQVGMNEQEILGWSAAMASMGIEAEAGGSAFSTMIKKVHAAVKTGGEDIAEYAQKAGMTSEELSRAVISCQNDMQSLADKAGASTFDLEKAVKSGGDSLEEYAKRAGMSAEDLSNAVKSSDEKMKDLAKRSGASVDKLSALAEAGNSSLATYAKMAGMTMEEFSDLWNRSSTEAFTALLKGISGAEDMTLALGELDITELRASDMMARLAGNTDLVTQAVGLANQGWNDNNALNKEVANKNEALSAKFEILKNRVTAVAAEVGEPLADALMDALEAAEPLFKAIEDGAEAFSNMDKEQQQAIITAAAHLAALGPLLSIVGRLGTGVGSAMSAFGGLVEKMNPATKAAEGATSVLGGLKGGLIGVGVAAAGVAVAFAVEKWMEYQHAVENVQKASKTLAELEGEAQQAVSGMGSVATDASGKISNYGKSVDETLDYIKDLNEEAARSSDAFVSGLKDAKVDSTMLSTYTDQIEKLTGKQQLNEEEQIRLKEAVDKYNEITGDSVDIIDASTGKLSKNTDEIMRNTREWEKNTYLQVYQQYANDALKDRIQREEELGNAIQNRDAKQRQLAEAQANYGTRVSELTEQLGDGAAAISLASAELDGYQREADNAQLAVDGLTTAIHNDNVKIDDAHYKAGKLTEQYNNTENQIGDLRGALEGFGEESVKRLGETGHSTDEMARKFQEAGIDAGKLREMGAEEFWRLWEECDGDVGKIIERLGQVAKTPVVVHANTGELDYLQDKLDALREQFEKGLTLEYLVVPAGVEKRSIVTKNANGGLFPEHADGGVFTRATLTPDGIVGEAGAEWYGQLANNMRAAIPLTSMRAKPFTDQIADGVSARLGQRGGDTYLVIDGAKVNADEEIEDKFYDLMMALKRKAGMYSGS